MKRKTMALILALSMCLSLLTACGSGNTATDDKPPESENAASSTEQPDESKQPEESEEQPEESEESKEEEPGESAEPTQEPKEESNAGTEFLALLQEEYQNGFFEGESPRHTYFDLREKQAFIYKDVVYIYGTGAYNDNYYSFCSYDIASKELRNVVSPEISSWASDNYMFNLNGNFYYANYGFDGNLEVETRMYDCNNKLLNSFQHQQYFNNCIPFECGILLVPGDGAMVFLSNDLQKIADIPFPQREIEHGLKEDVELSGWMFAADGTVYASSRESQPQLYRLNIDTYEWEDMGKWKNLYYIPDFCGKYISDVDGIYDRFTEEQVFEYGDLYPAASDNLCYFGGDKYLGFKDREYRWVNLKDLSMSDPLPFPEGKSVTILNDTYCVYKDQYGWFLWNYNTGEEETIYMFEQ